MMVLEDFAAISQLASVDALRVAAEQLAGELEFDRFGLHYVTPSADNGYHWTSLDNNPEGYREISRRPSFCPVMHHAKTSRLPLFWNRETYVRANRMGNWEEQAPWGYGTGVIVAAHLGDDKHVVFGVARESDLSDSPQQLTHKMAAFQLFATCVVDPCVTVLAGEAEPGLECPFTKRELEALQWTVAGKTAWEVGKLLGISERTAALHVNNASQKLGAVNKHQAALKALRLGWILWPAER